MSGVELVVSAVLPMLLERLSSSEVLQFLSRDGLNSNIKTLEANLNMIKAVLRDAEEKQLEEKNVQKWLDDLEDLAHDVEDILDEFATNVLTRDLKKEQHEQASTSKFHCKCMPIDISKVRPKAIKSRVRMGSEIEDVKHRLERVTSQLEQLCKLKDNLGLRETNGRTSTAVAIHKQRTTSHETEPAVYGREDDKAIILKMVFSGEPSATKFHVIPIVGMGGIGKTTLARKVYNDEAVKSFELKAWVCISNDFDVLKISKAIYENIYEEMCAFTELNVVQNKLKEKIAGKKFLFVLDDVWSNDPSLWKLWETLRSPFVVGARGSKIIVTTRDEAVASIMRSSTWLYKVQLLSDDDCWSLFKVHAFDDDVNPTHPNIQSIHEKVVEKSKGLPLASKVLGGLLYERNIDEWLKILNSKMWDLVDGSDIRATLKLSYYYLSSHLKRCFAYCSIFLEDYEFEKEELVHLWLTEGLIQPSNENKKFEDLGHKYFNDLLSRSLFQQSSSNKTKYVMHDLVRDLAHWASKGTCFHLMDMSSVDKPLESFKKARHLSYSQGYLDGKCKFEVISKVEQVEQRLRTFLPLAMDGKQSYISPMVISNLLPKLKKLRMLSLKDYQITELPESIGDLRHLRHLDLSGTRINSLPESISFLINLLILKLKGCSHLRKLPSKMRNLTKLRYLDIRGVHLDEMSLGIDKLIDLQYLFNFIVGERDEVTLKVLKNLEFLRELCISRLENMVNLYETSEMILKDKQKLRVLELKWNSQFDDTRNAEKEKKVLNLLQPHRDLERLTIKSYGGTEFPSWVGPSSFSKLIALTLESCVNCTVLPSLGLLKSLKDLTIRGMKRLKRIGNEFCGQHCSTPFQSLETFCLENLQDWKHWEPIKENENSDAFPLLREFSIKSCPHLCGSLPSCLPSLEKLVIKDCDQLVVSFSSLPKLCNLDIHGCKEMTCVDPINFKSLTSIILSKVAELGNWSKQDYFHKANLVSLPMVCYFSNLCKLKITHCNALTSLPMEMNHKNTCLESLDLSQCDSLKFIINGPLPSSLKRLEIYRCAQLEYLWDDREVSCTSVVDKENHTSVLEYLRVNHCTSLTNLSLSGRLPSTLSCLSLKALPELESIADSFHDNISLEEITIYDCEKLTTISNGLHNCSRLRNIEISWCASIVKLAEDGLPKDKLSRLYIYNCEKLEDLPKDFHSLDSLEDLSLCRCANMRSFPEEGFPTNLTSLAIVGEVNIYKPLLEWGLHNLTILKTLRIYRSPKAESSFVEQEMGMRLPLSLTHLSIHEFPNSKWVLSQDFQNLNSLERLDINDCPNLTSFPKVSLPSSLQSLYIDRCPRLTSISELGLPSSLESLDIRECLSLTSISELGLPSSLQSLHINICSCLTSVSELGLPSSLQSLRINICPSLTSVSELGLPSSLQSLHIWGCPSLTSISELVLSSSLQSLDIQDCRSLTSISELGLPSSLQFLDIQGCPSLTSISELVLPSSLQSLDIRGCLSLTSISELVLPSSLQYLHIWGCPSLTSISKLGLPSSLLVLNIDYCSNLKFLTEQCLPSSLLELRIKNCAMLKKECKRDKGKVWPNISHIPRVEIDWKSIDELEDGE